MHDEKINPTNEESAEKIREKIIHVCWECEKVNNSTANSVSEGGINYTQSINFV